MIKINKSDIISVFDNMPELEKELWCLLIQVKIYLKSSSLILSVIYYILQFLIKII